MEITPFLWYDKQAKEAAEFYTSIFKDSKITGIRAIHDTSSGNTEIVSFELCGKKFNAMSAGPIFRFTHAISFFVDCETEKEIDEIWNRLSEGHKHIFWQLQKYPFSEKYGWITDKYGLSWQLFLSRTKQDISTFLMFDGDVLGKAEEAMRFYVEVFKDSGINSIERYGPENKRCEGLIVHANFKILGNRFMTMDSGMPADHRFNEAVSLVINCNDQKEIDYYWEKLSANPKAEQCGWLKDKYGLSWQIFPLALGTMLQDKDKKKIAMVTQALFKMKKLDIKILEKAYRGEQ